MVLYKTTATMSCISKTDLKNILESVLPNDVIHKVASYHAHPIIEYIGLDEIKKQYDNLSVYRYFQKHQKAKRKVQYDSLIKYYFDRDWTIRGMNDKLYFCYPPTLDFKIRKIFYPLDKTTLKKDILSYAEQHHICLKKSWTKTKMLEEVYKQLG